MQSVIAALVLVLACQQGPVNMENRSGEGRMGAPSGVSGQPGVSLAVLTVEWQREDRWWLTAAPPEGVTLWQQNTAIRSVWSLERFAGRIRVSQPCGCTSPAWCIGQRVTLLSLSGTPVAVAEVPEISCRQRPARQESRAVRSKD